MSKVSLSQYQIWNTSSSPSFKSWAAEEQMKESMAVDWVFPLSLMIVAFITLATSALQGWRATTENPEESIKTE